VIPLTGGMVNSGLGNKSIPAFEDLDGSGFMDIVHMVSTTGAVEVWLRAPFQQQITTGEPESSADIARHESEFMPGDATVSEPGEIDFAFNVPVTSPAKTHVELILVHQDDPSTNDVDHQAFYHGIHELEADGGVPEATQKVLLGGQETGDFWVNRDHYYMRYRFVVADPSAPTTTISNPGRWFVGGWTIRWANGPTAYDLGAMSSYMLSNGGIANSQFTLITEAPISGGQSTALGAYVPMTRVPPFAPGAVPTIPAIVEGPDAVAFEPE